MTPPLDRPWVVSSAIRKHNLQKRHLMQIPVQQLPDFSAHKHVLCAALALVFRPGAKNKLRFLNWRDGLIVGIG